jgi:hypothetical protein
MYVGERIEWVGDIALRLTDEVVLVESEEGPMTLVDDFVSSRGNPDGGSGIHQ